MPPVGFESTISVLERAKTVRALDRAGTAIGIVKIYVLSFTTFQSLTLHICELKLLNLFSLEVEIHVSFEVLTADVTRRTFLEFDVE
jgi:hypothetical protein